jgi:hypothetical protein
MERVYIAVPRREPAGSGRLGRLLRARLRYSITDGRVELTGNKRFYHQRAAAREDLP